MRRVDPALRALRRLGRAGLAVLLLSLAGLTACASAPSAPPRPEARAVVAHVNEIRASQGLAPLKPHRQLFAAARAHARDQARAGRISHTGTDGSALPLRLRRAGYAPAAAGENVASGWRRPADVAQGWWESPGHRENLLRPSATEVGVGLAEAEGGRAYWTLIVASPAS